MVFIKKKVKLKYKYNDEEKEITGYIMESGKDYYILKLKNGYNIGIKKNSVISIEKISEEKVEEKKFSFKKKGKDKLYIINLGGTIASKIDYAVGGVSAQFTAEDLIIKYPEINEIFDLEAYNFMNIMSEDIKASNWKDLNKFIRSLDLENVKGIIITHGTDTMHYTAAALSFLLSDLNMPIVITGAQRSSDRPSTDAALNLLGGAYFIKNTKSRGVFVAMHSNISDKEINIIIGTRARKMHSSRRDAFKSINCKDLARVIFEKNDVFFEDFKEIKKPKFFPFKDFSNDVGIFFYYPEADLETFIKNKKAVIILGTGLGHISNRDIKIIEKNKDKLFFIAVQTIFGSTNLKVYSTGRKLLKAGVIELKDMTAETAYVKLKLLMSKLKNKEEISKEMLKAYFYEVSDRLLE